MCIALVFGGVSLFSLTTKAKELVQIKFLAWTFICHESHNLIPISGPMPIFFAMGRPKLFHLRKHISEKFQQLLVAAVPFLRQQLCSQSTYIYMLYRVFLAALLCMFTCRCWRIWEQWGHPDHWSAVKKACFLQIIAFGFRSTVCFYSHP